MFICRASKFWSGCEPSLGRWRWGALFELSLRLGGEIAWRVGALEAIAVLEICPDVGRLFCDGAVVSHEFFGWRFRHRGSVSRWWLCWRGSKQIP